MHIACRKDACFGCLTCVTACLAQRYDITESNAVPPRLHLPRGTADGEYITDSCRHCVDAPCMRVCPAGALERDTQGFVCLKDALCIGCQSCADACPYQIPRFGADGTLVKCDGCSARVACGLPPVCVAACPACALELVEDVCER